jgi:hypothetical protein
MQYRETSYGGIVCSEIIASRPIMSWSARFYSKAWIVSRQIARNVATQRVFTE